jgi:hypothetical protein
MILSKALYIIPAPTPFHTHTPAAAVSVDWTWKESIHTYYKIGYQVEVLAAFKPKYSAFVGYTAIIRRIFAKNMGPNKHNTFTFFLEVQGKDANETASISNIIKIHNNKCFTDFLCGDARSLMPCKLKSMRKMDAAAASSSNGASSNAASSNASSSNAAGSNAASSNAQGASKKPRLEQQQPPADEIKLGDAVEILKTLYIMKEFTGYHGLVRKIAKRESFTACWVEITRTSIGRPAPPHLPHHVQKKNTNFYTEPEMWLPWVCCRVENIVRADPELPDPFTPETWAALPVNDRKTHRHKQQQDKSNARVGDNVQIKRIIGIDWYPASFVGFQGVVRSVQDNLFHTTCYVELTHNQAGAPVTPEQTKTIEDWNKGTCTPEERSFMKCNMEYVVRADPKLPSPDKAQIHRDRPRHRKYSPAARAPWRGGEVKPFLYGRKITFILSGERGEPITR